MNTTPNTHTVPPSERSAFDNGTQLGTHDGYEHDRMDNDQLKQIASTDFCYSNSHITAFIEGYNVAYNDAASALGEEQGNIDRQRNSERTNREVSRLATKNYGYDQPAADAFVNGYTHNTQQPNPKGNPMTTRTITDSRERKIVIRTRPSIRFRHRYVGDASHKGEVICAISEYHHLPTEEDVIEILTRRAEYDHLGPGSTKEEWWTAMRDY